MNKSALTDYTKKGFTLIELLVVIAIIGILAIITYLVIDPIEIRRKSQDTRRLSELETLNQVITTAIADATASGSEVLCAGGIATPCTGSSNPGTVANRKTDGTGWVKVNLTGRAATLPVLPVDPTNTGVNVYTYTTNAAGDAWEINTVLTSKEYTIKQPLMVDDGGNNDTVLEKGSVLDIIP